MPDTEPSTRERPYACPVCRRRYCTAEHAAGCADDHRGETSAPRPSVHPPLTKSYAIDQIDDIEHLRAVAHRMWEAFFAAHAQAAHQWQEWQRKVDAGFGSV